ncbi:MAG: hypothetical protein ACKOX6_16390 [Bdellovibrio sp.]
MRILSVLVLILGFQVAQAQSINVKDIPSDSDSDTTISVKKGKNADRQFEITTGEDDIEGEEANLIKEARANWKKACADWKKETKELNKDNQVLSLNCGKMVCSTENMESTCQSKGKYKLKVQVK